MNGITVEEGLDALRNMGLKVNVRPRKIPRSEAVLKGIIMNPSCKAVTRELALLELQQLKQSVTAEQTDKPVEQTA